MHVFGSVSCEASRYFFSNVIENIICSLSLMFLKIISAAWEVFCGVSLRSILNPADSSKHWLSAHSLNILLLGDHFVFPEAWLILWKRVITWRSYPPQTHNAKNLRKKQGYAISIGGEGGMRAALSYVTTEEQSASGRVCSLSPTELLAAGDELFWVVSLDLPWCWFSS